MKLHLERPWLLTGALGIAAAAGLYLHDSNIFYRQEGRFVQEYLDLPEPDQEDLEKNTSKTPHDEGLTAKKEEDRKNPKKNKHSASKFPEKTLSWANPRDRYKSASPKNQHLEEKVEEDTERPWYDLPAKQRNLLDALDISRYFYAALEADDYKVAESYIDNSQILLETEAGHEADNGRHEIRKYLSGRIISSYHNFLDEVIENCDKDYDSVFRKVMWMNFFMTTNEDIFPIFLPTYDQIDGKKFSLFDMLQKGDEALEAIEYCIEKKDN